MIFKHSVPFIIVLIIPDPVKINTLDINIIPYYFPDIFVVTILVAIGVCASGQYAHKLMVKDGRLEGLVHLLNSRESRILFQNWKGNLNDSTAFL